MSSIETLVYSAYEHGQRENLFKEVDRIRGQRPNMSLSDIYEEAYGIVMKTR